MITGFKWRVALPCWQQRSLKSTPNSIQQHRFRLSSTGNYKTGDGGDRLPQVFAHVRAQRRLQGDDGCSGIFARRHRVRD